MSSNYTGIAGPLGRNTRALGRATNSLMTFTDVVSRLGDSFSKADKLQNKANALGTNLNRILERNHRTLLSLKGSFFDNAEEMLRNYSVGLRDNSDGLNLLVNRMKVTGQNTDSARMVMQDLAFEIGYSTEAIDRLSLENIKLARAYGISNETLLKTLKSIDSERELASILGASEQLSYAAMQLKGLYGFTDDKVAMIIKGLVSPDDLAQRATYGIIDAEDQILDSSKSSEEVLQEILKYIEIMGSKVDEQVKATKFGNLKGSMTTSLLNSMGNRQELIAFRNARESLQNRLATVGAIQSQTDEYGNTFDNFIKEYNNTFERIAGDAYPKIINLLTGIKTAVGAGATGAALGGAGALGLSLIRGGGLLGMLRVLGPLGAIAGIAAPAIISAFTSNASDKDAETKRRDSANLAEINRKTPEPASAKDTFSLDSQVLDNLMRAAFNTFGEKMSPSKSDPHIAAMGEFVDKLGRYTDAVSRKQTVVASIPSSFGYVGGNLV